MQMQQQTHLSADLAVFHPHGRGEEPGNDKWHYSPYNPFGPQYSTVRSRQPPNPAAPATGAKAIQIVYGAMVVGYFGRH